MNTQNTPVHIRLWHRHFWFLALAYMLLSVAVSAFIPTLPDWLADEQRLSSCGVAFSVGCFGLGILFLGGFCNYFVQRYRRKFVCVFCLCAMMALFALHYYIIMEGSVFPAYLWCVLRVVQGAFFGLAQMVLSGILVIDVCESYNRTEANYCMSWFFRLGLAIGSVLGIVIGAFMAFYYILLLCIACLALAVLLILSVHCPFRAPDEAKLLSLDRFWLPHGWLLSVNLLLFSLAIGMFLSVMHTLEFFSILMIGFLASLLAQRIIFVNAELKSEVVCGLLLAGAAFLLQVTRNLHVVQYVVPIFIGLGIGLVSGRFLLFFIKLSRHCQRGTSQSTYNISWEVGIWGGLAVGYAFSHNYISGGGESFVVSLSLGLVVIALLLYNFMTHRWYLSNKNR